MIIAIFLLAIFGTSAAQVQAVVGSQCSKNQVVNKLVVNEDGSLVAECMAAPCGAVGRKCLDYQASCRPNINVFSGMRWATNGESILLRCCTMQVPSHLYVGTDVVSAGSYYEGGAVAKKDFYSQNSGAEYDFIANARVEQGGVRIWVYRIICGPNDKPIDFEQSITTTTTTTTMLPRIIPAFTKMNTEANEVVRALDAEEEYEEAEFEESNDEEATEDQEEEEETTAPSTLAPKSFNPLRYRPPSLPRSSTGVRRA